LRYGIFLLLLTLVNWFETRAQDTDSITVALQPIVVTAHRTPTVIRFVNRSIDITGESALNNFALSSVEDVLQRSPNINVQSRGPFGVQTDLSIRGTLFSQNALLLNGARIDDPQTAHHNFNIPVTLDMIERIEILRGPGSAQYGANAFGGVVNIITKVPDHASASLQTMGGQNGLFGGTLHAEIAGSSVRSVNSLSYKKSDGYHEDTDFSLASFCTSNEIDVSVGQLTILGGYSQKEFGAYDFYSPGAHKPSREWTNTGYLNLALAHSFSSFKIIPRLSYRRHNDRFMDDRRTPDRNVNDHTTQVLQGEVVALTQLSESVSVTGGIDIARDNITSNVYGSHERFDGGTFASVLLNMLPWTFDGAIRFNTHSEYGTVLCPTIGMGYLFGGNGKLYITAGRAFRAPTYTELYIHTPQILGNSKLRPEIGWSYEIGSTYIILPSTQISVAVFQNEQKDLIDYVKFSSTDIFHAANFTRARIRGAELSVQWKNDHFTDSEINLQHITLSYGYLDSHIERDSVFAARYSFIHPRHQIAFSAIGALPLTTIGSIGIVHKIKLNGKSYSLIDARVSKRMSMFTISISGTNLLNQSYEEIVGVPLPGRWLWATVEYKIY
jgi:vitamin B12 transporter